MIFSFFSKKLGFWVFLVHPTVVSVLLSASVERCFVSRMWDFYFKFYPRLISSVARSCLYFIGHPISHNNKTIPSLDRVGIDLMDPNLNPTFAIQSPYQPSLVFLFKHKLILTKRVSHKTLVFDVKFVCCHKLSNTLLQTLENRPQVGISWILACGKLVGVACW